MIEQIGEMLDVDVDGDIAASRAKVDAMLMEFAAIAGLNTDAMDALRSFAQLVAEVERGTCASQCQEVWAKESQVGAWRCMMELAARNPDWT